MPAVGKQSGREEARAAAVVGAQYCTSARILLVGLQYNSPAPVKDEADL